MFRTRTITVLVEMGMYVLVAQMQINYSNSIPVMCSNIIVSSLCIFQTVEILLN
jgi:hypothetical protein